MSRHLPIRAALIPALAIQAFAQGPTLIGLAYHAPTRDFAPGQIVRLQVAGLKSVLPVTSDGTTTQRASSVPLPTTMAGISVTVTEYSQRFIMGDLSLVGSWKAPLLSIAQSNNCTNLKGPVFPAECFVTYITAQMPYEVQFNLVANPFYYVEAVISENGIEGPTFGMASVSDQIHVVSTCEDDVFRTCRSVVTHADGTQIAANSPARPGETVVVYAWGLGQTTPRVKTGDFTPVPAPVISLNGSSTLSLRFDFSPNAAPARYPYAGAPLQTAKAYLTPGQVGLYQVNIQLPATFPPVPACGQDFVDSNLTINLLGPVSFDGAAICVK